MVEQWSTWAVEHLGEILAGLVGGVIVATLTEIVRYIRGRLQAGRNEDACFHIAATMYTPIDLNDPYHAKTYHDALMTGKTHVQELLWLGEEIPLSTFLGNPFVLHEVSRGIDRSKNEGLLLGKLHEDAERPLLKQILGYHNRIPATDLVRLYKTRVGTTSDGRVFGISPPTSEDYAGSKHRRVLRAMFVAESQLTNGIPDKEKVYFANGEQAHRHDTLTTLIDVHRKNPHKFDRCRAYF